MWRQKLVCKLFFFFNLSVRHQTLCTGQGRSTMGRERWTGSQANSALAGSVGAVDEVDDLQGVPGWAILSFCAPAWPDVPVWLPGDSGWCRSWRSWRPMVPSDHMPTAVRWQLCWHGIWVVRLCVSYTAEARDMKRTWECGENLFRTVLENRVYNTLFLSEN